jgi:hypothetical protein
MACFYGAACLLLGLLLHRTLRRELGILLSAVVPFLVFAVFVFEPSSPERFLPTLPFVAAAIAAALTNCRRRALKTVLGVLVLCPAIPNVLAMRTASLDQRLEAVRERQASLERKLSRPGLVFVLSLRDDLYALPLVRPLARDLNSNRYELMDVVEIGSSRLLRWRQEFAERSLAAWREGRDVWISTRLMADRPKAAWQWVEGDSPLVRWSELPHFFRQFQISETAGPAADGFLLVSAGPANKALLQGLVEQATE